MSDKEGRQLVRALAIRGSIYTLGAVAPVIMALLVTPALTRLLEPSAYGEVASALVLIQVGSLLGGLGLATSITRSGILEKTGVRGARTLALVGVVISASVLLLAWLSSENWAFAVFKASSSSSIAYALCACWGMIALLNSQAVLRVEDRAGFFVGLGLASALGGAAIGIIFLLVSPGATSATYLSGLAIGYVVFGLLALLLSSIRGVSSPSFSEFGRAVAVGIPSVPHQLAIYFCTGALVLLASRQFGSVEGAKMQLALVVGSAPSIVLSAVNNAWAPSVYRSPAASRGIMVAKTATHVMTVAIILALGASLMSPFLMRYLAPAAYQDATLPLQVAVIASGTVFIVTYLANVHLIFASGRTATLSLITPIALLVSMAAAYAISVHFESPVGVAAGFPLAYLTLSVLIAIARRITCASDWSESSVALKAIVGGGLVFMSGFIPSTEIWSAVRIAVFSVVLIGFGLGAKRRFRA